MGGGVCRIVPLVLDAIGRVGRQGPEQQDRLLEQPGAELGRSERPAQVGDQLYEHGERVHRLSSGHPTTTLAGLGAE